MCLSIWRIFEAYDRRDDSSVVFECNYANLIGLNEEKRQNRALWWSREKNLSFFYCRCAMLLVSCISTEPERKTLVIFMMTTNVSQRKSFDELEAKMERCKKRLLWWCVSLFNWIFSKKEKCVIHVWYRSVCVDVHLSILVLALLKKSKVKEIQFIHIFFF